MANVRYFKLACVYSLKLILVHVEKDLPKVPMLRCWVDIILAISSAGKRSAWWVSLALLRLSVSVSPSVRWFGPTIARMMVESRVENWSL